MIPRGILRLPVIATVVAALVVGGYVGVAQWGARHKLAGLGEIPARGSYRIVLDFAPERFHQTRMQEMGRLVEVRDRTIYMMDVTPAALRRIAGEYWVDSVVRWDGKR